MAPQPPDLHHPIPAAGGGPQGPLRPVCHAGPGAHPPGHDGRGEFYGPTAYEEFKKLASVFYEGGAGPLIHPVWQSSKAYFVELALAQEPRKDYVRYTFTFWETFEGYSQGLTGQKTPETSRPRTYILAQGETFRSVARDCGLTETELLALNPQVKNPGLVKGGSALYVK